MRTADRAPFAFGAPLFALLLALPAAASEEVWQRSYEFDPHGIVSVTNVYGSVRIEGWDRAEVSAEAWRRSMGGAGSPEEVRIQVEEEEGRMGFRTEYLSAEDSDVRVDYLVKIPRQAVVEFVGTLEGDIELRGLEGAVSAHALNGNVRAMDLAGQGVFRAGNGNIAAAYRQLPEADGLLRFESIRGHVTLMLPGGADADLTMETVAGRIETPYRTEASGGLDDPGVHARVGQGGLEIRVRTVRGNIRVLEGSRTF